jgi:hypothetical protein
MVTKNSKWFWGRPIDHKTYPHLLLNDPTKFTQIGRFGLKIYHLATLALVCICISSNHNLRDPPRSCRCESYKSDIHFFTFLVWGSFDFSRISYKISWLRGWVELVWLVFCMCGRVALWKMSLSFHLRCLKKL